MLLQIGVIKKLQNGVKTIDNRQLVVYYYYNKANERGEKMRDVLIEARGKKTQADASTEIGISQKYLSKLELGQRTPSLKIAIKIASYYKKSVEDLFPDIFLANNSPKSSIE